MHGVALMQSAELSALREVQMSIRILAARNVSGWLTIPHHSSGNRSRLKKNINIPAGTLKIGLLESDAQTAKEATVISFSGVVKARRNQTLALQQVLCDVVRPRTTQNAARPVINLCQKREALMLQMSPTEAA